MIKIVDEFFSIYKFEYKGDIYKVLVKNTEEKGNSHIYPIYKNFDYTIKELPFYIGNIDLDHIYSHIKNFKYISSLNYIDYFALQKKWPFAKIFKDKLVKITNYNNINPYYVE